MNKSKDKKVEKPVKGTPASCPASKRKKGKSDAEAKELFGVHIISEQDIKNHFGTPDSEANAKARRESDSSNESEKKG